MRDVSAVSVGSMMNGDRDSGLGLAEVVAAFSLATDLGLGQPMEHVLRSWAIATRLGEHMGIESETAASLYYVSMLAWVGCVADTPEVASWFGDDIAFRRDSYEVDLAGLPMFKFALGHVGAGQPALHRLRLAGALVVTGGKAIERGLMSHCLSTALMAERLGLGDEVCEPLQQWFTRWDGSGVPDGVGGDDVARCVRLFHLADCVEVAHQRGGVGAAIELARSRRGKHFDPEVVDAFCAVACRPVRRAGRHRRLAHGDRVRIHDFSDGSPSLVSTQRWRRSQTSPICGRGHGRAIHGPWLHWRHVRASCAAFPRAMW